LRNDHFVGFWRVVVPHVPAMLTGDQRAVSEYGSVMASFNIPFKEAIASNADYPAVGAVPYYSGATVIGTVLGSNFIVNTLII